MHQNADEIRQLATRCHRDGLSPAEVCADAPTLEHSVELELKKMHRFLNSLKSPLEGYKQEPVWQAGMTVGKCLTLVECVGMGGFGKVWKAETKKKDVVALKLIPFDKASTSERALRRLRYVHVPNLMPILRAWKEDGFLMLCMPLASESLNDVFETTKKNNLRGMCCERLFEYLLPIARALDFLRTRDIQHGDVKPENVVLLGGSPVLTDYDLSCQIGTCSGSSEGFSPPEVRDIHQRKTAASTDQYSLAVTYCMLRGATELPSSWHDTEAYGKWLDTNEWLFGYNEICVIHKALSCNPASRWPSCAEFVRKLIAEHWMQRPAYEELLSRVSGPITLEFRKVLEETVFYANEKFKKDADYVQVRQRVLNVSDISTQAENVTTLMKQIAGGHQATP